MPGIEPGIGTSPDSEVEMKRTRRDRHRGMQKAGREKEDEERGGQTSCRERVERRRTMSGGTRKGAPAPGLSEREIESERETERGRRERVRESPPQPVRRIGDRPGALAGYRAGARWPREGKGGREGGRESG